MADADTPPIEDGVPEEFSRATWRGGFGNQVGPIYQRFSEDGTWARGFLVGERHTNGFENCHGGMLMAFADMAFGSVVTYEKHRFWVTVRLVTDFVSSASLGEFVQGNATISGVDGDFIAVRGHIWTGGNDPKGPDARTLMTGTGLFKMLGERPGESPLRAFSPKLGV